MRSRDWAWWRPVLGLLMLVAIFGVARIVLLAVTYVSGVLGQVQARDLLQPVTLLLDNATLALAIPIVFACWAAVHGMRIGWSSSVLGRLRRRLLVPWLLRALATVGVAALLLVLLYPLLSGGAYGGPDPSYGWLVLVVLLTIPLQAAAEEYVFRGYLSQAIAAWVRHPQVGAVVSAVVSAALFSAAHSPPGVGAFLLRFGLGLAASALVWATGGLEAAVVMHAVYRMVLFLAGGALGSVTATSSDPGSALTTTWWGILLSFAGMAGFVWWVWRDRDQVGVELLSPALDLRGWVPPRPVGWPAVPAPQWVPRRGPQWAPQWRPAPPVAPPRPGRTPEPPPDLRWAPPDRS